VFASWRSKWPQPGLPASRRRLGKPLRLETLEDRTLLAGHTPATAALLSFTRNNTAATSGFLATSEQTDWFGVNLSAGDTVTASVETQEIGSGLDSMLRVLGSDGRQIAFNHDFQGRDSRLTFQAPTAGVYDLGVSGFSATSQDPNLTLGGGNAATGLYALALSKNPEQPLLPQLAGASLYLDDDAALWGDPVTVHYTIENRGGAAAAPFGVEVRLSADNRMDARDTLLTTSPVAGLAAGASTTGTVTVALPGAPGQPPATFREPGKVFLGLRIDPGATAGQLDKNPVSSPERGNDWDALTILTLTPAGATHLGLNARTRESVTAGDVNTYQITPDQAGRLIARVHTDDGRTSLSLLDSSGKLLIESDGVSPTDPDDLIVQHLAGGTSYLLQVSSLGDGAAPYALDTEFQPAIPPVQPLPNEETPPGVSEDPHNLVAADFTGAGITDLAVTNQVAGTVSILLGLGDGTFHEVSDAQGNPVRPAVGKGPTAVIAGDFTGDGIPDLAVVNRDDNTVSILLGNGDGTFRPATDAHGDPLPALAVGDLPVAIAAGDFTHDGHLDLAVVNQGDDSVSILLGNGDGTFQKARDIPVGPSPTSIVVGDFNGDGTLDFATANEIQSPILPTVPGNISVFLGNGDGTFRPVTDTAGDPVPAPSVGIKPTSLVAGDFTGDGNLDLAVGDEGELSSNIVVLLGHGDGTFTEVHDSQGRPVRPSVEGRPFALVTGDFNGDGHLDLASANDRSFDVSVLLGNGDGTFQTEVKLATDKHPTSLVAGDFNGDGRTDLATGNSSTRDVSVFLGVGDGTFQGQTRAGVGLDPVAVVSGDFNNDGRPDLATVNSNAVSILLSNGDGTFQRTAEYPVGKGPSALITTDLNGDGRPDLVVANGVSADLSILLGLGDGTFREISGPKIGGSPAAVVAGDFNGDGIPDLAVANGNGVVVLLGKGDGTFQKPVEVFVGSDTVAVAAGDFNEDGHLDLAVADQGSNDVTILLGNGDGTFHVGPVYPVGQFPQALVAGHFTGAKHLDLAIANKASDDVSVLLGNGDGTFQAAQSYPVGTHPTSIVTGNFHARDDGIQDLAVVNQDDGTVSVLLGNGDGTFQTQVQTPPIGTSPGALAAGDFNGDGRTDLAVADTAAAAVTVLLGLGNATFTAPGAIASTDFQSTPLLADINGDGVPDSLVVDLSGRILVRLGQADSPGEFAPPILINDPQTHPARAATILRAGSQILVAALDKNQNVVSFYTHVSAANQPGAFMGRRSDLELSLPLGALPVRILPAHLRGTSDYDDLVVLNGIQGDVSVFLADGHGGFLSGPHISVGNGPTDIAVADLTGAGMDDILVSNQLSGDVSMLLNDGTGTHFTERRFRAGTGVYSSDPQTGAVVSPERSSGLAVGDFTGDGIADVLVTSAGSNSFSLLLGLGGGHFLNPESFTLPFSPSLVVAGRFNDDGDGRTGLRGYLDAALLDKKTGRLAILLGDDTGQFQEKLNDASGQVIPLLAGNAPAGLVVNDVDGDGLPDLQVASVFGDLLTLDGKGDGTFQTPSGDKIALAGSRSRDGQATFVLANEAKDRVSALYPGANQSVPIGQRANGILAPGAVTLADLNGDGIPDAIVANSGGNSILVYLGRPNGQFPSQPDQQFFVGTDPVSVTVADLNGDGIPDLVVTNKGSNDISILLGQGQRDPVTGAILNWTLTPGPRLRAGLAPTSTVVQDVFGNGKPDILVSNSQSNDVYLLHGLGNGFFQDATPLVIPVGTDPVQILPVMTARGPGVATINAESNSVTFLSDLAATPVRVDVTSGGENPTVGVAGDFTGDGLSDLIVANSGNGMAELLLSQPDGSFLERTKPTGFLDPTGLALPTLVDGGVEVFLAGDGQDGSVLPLLFGLSALAPVPLPPPTPGLAPVLLPLQETTLAIVVVLLTGSPEGIAQDSPAASEAPGAPLAGLLLDDLPGPSANVPLSLGGGEDGGRTPDESEANTGAGDLAAWSSWLTGASEGFQSRPPSDFEGKAEAEQMPSAAQSARPQPESGPFERLPADEPLGQEPDPQASERRTPKDSSSSGIRPTSEPVSTPGPHRQDWPAADSDHKRIDLLFGAAPTTLATRHDEFALMASGQECPWTPSSNLYGDLPSFKPRGEVREQGAPVEADSRAAVAGREGPSSWRGPLIVLLGALAVSQMRGAMQTVPDMVRQPACPGDRPSRAG
jgi:hypothetical protein